MKTIAIIPARIASVRLYKKLLLEVKGKSILEYTFNQAKKSKFVDDVVIATDSEEIVKACAFFGAKAFLTSSKHISGSDRIAEVVSRHPEFRDAEYIINVQGDEPTISPHTIDQVVLALKNTEDASVATAIFPVQDKDSLISSSCVKCVRDLRGYALYFSRALIPSGKKEGIRKEVTYFKHLGIYGYKKEFLLTYASLPPSPMQIAEDLEQLKILENGYKMITTVVEEDTRGIDTEKDFQLFKKMKESK